MAYSVKWYNINEKQPEDFKTVLVCNDNGYIITGQYMGKKHCDHMRKFREEQKKFHPTKKIFGKYARYFDVAEKNMFVAKWWAELPCKPKQLSYKRGCNND